MLTLSAFHGPSDLLAWATADAESPALRAPALPDDPCFVCEQQVDVLAGTTRSERERLTPRAVPAKALPGGHTGAGPKRPRARPPPAGGVRSPARASRARA
jgi:hypothetical protein